MSIPPGCCLFIFRKPTLPTLRSRVPPSSRAAYADDMADKQLNHFINDSNSRHIRSTHTHTEEIINFFSTEWETTTKFVSINANQIVSAALIFFLINSKLAHFHNEMIALLGNVIFKKSFAFFKWKIIQSKINKIK